MRDYVCACRVVSLPSVGEHNVAISGELACTDAGFCERSMSSRQPSCRLHHIEGAVSVFQNHLVALPCPRRIRAVALLYR